MHEYDITLRSYPHEHRNKKQMGRRNWKINELRFYLIEKSFTVRVDARRHWSVVYLLSSKIARWHRRWLADKKTAYLIDWWLEDFQRASALFFVVIFRSDWTGNRFLNRRTPGSCQEWCKQQFLPHLMTVRHSSLRYQTICASLSIWPDQKIKQRSLGFCPFDINLHSSFLCWSIELMHLFHEMFVSFRGEQSEDRIKHALLRILRRLRRCLLSLLISSATS